MNLLRAPAAVLAVLLLAGCAGQKTGDGSGNRSAAEPGRPPARPAADAGYRGLCRRRAPAGDGLGTELEISPCSCCRAATTFPGLARSPFL